MRRSFRRFAGAGGTGSALDQATLVHMRDADALVQVVRCFRDAVSGECAGARRDIRQLSERADPRRPGDRREAPRTAPQEKGKEQEVELLDRCRAALESDAAAPRRALRYRGRALSDSGLLTAFR